MTIEVYRANRAYRADGVDGLFGWNLKNRTFFSLCVLSLLVVEWGYGLRSLWLHVGDFVLMVARLWLRVGDFVLVIAC